MTRHRIARTIALLSMVAATAGQNVWAQTPDSAPGRLTGEVTGTGARVHIAIPGDRTGGAQQEFIDTVRADLEFSGYFEVLGEERSGLVPAAGADGRPDHLAWQAAGADAIVGTRFTLQGGRIDLQARLFDAASGTLLLDKRYGGEAELLRRVAHRLADDLVRHYTGRPGLALSRIAFVSRHRSGAGEGKEIYVMDYDGRRVRRLTTTGTINLAPAWSPGGDELAFVSWRGRQPGVYVMSADGELGSLRTVGGELTSAPEWSPDGRLLAYSANVDGNAEIYLLDRAVGRNRRLTHHPSIDTAPAYSPNGREIAFTSDRAGNPQIYIMDTDGLNVRRVSMNGNYNDSAAWSPRGDQLAYTSRVEGRFEIVILDLATGRTQQITRGEGNNENPRWSPDGRHLVFASSRRGTYDIYTMRADGTAVRRLTTGGESITPDWSR